MKIHAFYIIFLMPAISIAQTAGTGENRENFFSPEFGITTGIILSETYTKDRFSIGQTNYIDRKLPIAGFSGGLRLEQHLAEKMWLRANLLFEQKGFSVRSIIFRNH